MRYEESDKVKLKREMVDHLDKEIVAFLNARGGVIYIGVDDQGRPVSVPPELRDRYDGLVGNLIGDAIAPSCRSKVQLAYNEDGVLEIRIEEGDQKPYYLASKGPRPGGTFVRLGRSVRQVDQEEILHPAMDSRDYSFEKGVSERQDLTFRHMHENAEEQGLPFGPDKFMALGIQDAHGKFTNLGLLLSEESPVVVKFAVYTEGMDFKVKKEFRGSLVHIARSLLEYVEMFNDTSARILQGQAERVETKSFPGASMREAVLNAICHADYSLPSSIKIELHPGYARIINPGNVFHSTLEAALNGLQTFRNPGLVRIFDKLGLIENYGTGLLRIREAYENDPRKPEFQVIDRYFFVTLPNLNYEEAVEGDATKNPILEEGPAAALPPPPSGATSSRRPSSASSRRTQGCPGRRWRTPPGPRYARSKG